MSSDCVMQFDSDTDTEYKLCALVQPEFQI